MSAKSKKIELNEEFVERRTEPLGDFYVFISIKTTLTSGHKKSLQPSIRRLVVV